MTNDVTTVTRFGGFQRSVRSGAPRSQLVADPVGTFAADLRAEVDGVAARAPVAAVSLDVFDTLLIRRPVSELRRFYEIACLWAGTESRFVERRLNGIDLLVARFLATHAAYQSGRAVQGCREGTLDDIVANVAESLRLYPGAYERMKEIELSYERGELTVNQPLLDACRPLLDAGARLVLLSDMYLSSSQIDSLLEDSSIPEHQTFSSSDLKISKRSGHGYDHLALTLGVEPHQIIHIGDSLLSDYQQAVRAGLRAIHLPIPEVERSRIAADHLSVRSALLAAGFDTDRWIRCPFVDVRGVA